MKGRAAHAAFACLSIGAAILSHASPSPAELTIEQCVNVHARGQDLRREGKLAAARSDFTACAATACPPIVRNDCARRLDEVDRVQPAFVFEAVDSSGLDVADVRVTLDGQPLVDRLDGRSLKVDPGAHEFRFEARDRAPVTVHVVAREGDASRHERVRIGPATGAEPSRLLAPPQAGLDPGSPSSEASSAPPRGSSSPPQSRSDGIGRVHSIIAWSVLGAGVAGLGVGAVFGLKAMSDWKSVERACGGNALQCTDPVQANPLRESAINGATVSTVSFIAGGLLAATGATLLLVGGPPAGRTDGNQLALGVTAGIGVTGAGIALRGQIW